MKAVLIGLTLVIFVGGCAPTVKLAAPDKPIVINLNVKIEHEIRVRIDKELDQVFDDAELF